MKKEKFDVNPLTLIPGGSFITIEFSDGSFTRGINVKSARKYLETVITESLLKGIEVTRAYFTGGDKAVIYENGQFFSTTNK